MTILSGQTIRRMGIVSPHAERTKSGGMTYGLGPAGYDVRIREKVQLWPGDFALASIEEHLSMPNNVLGIVHDKSTWARRGVALQNTVVEPGWRGILTIELSNHGTDRLLLMPGTPIAQIVFHLLDEPAERPYPEDGKYQDQRAGPQQARYE